ncbi:hypothetical protein Q5P01_003123 [Channa striata]|uniref:Ig-like domain-containing protein n=1 Tax=Channa striata TaxID=64152 RepID=A0AA88NQL9_CHASR|nr:hypothetical protein Q5P01_003123 [Channa striata]
MKMFVMFVTLLLVSQHVVTVEVNAGDESVLLLCKTSFVPQGTTVTWSRKDLNSSTVLKRLEDGDDLKDQNQRYSGRTSMKPDALTAGDFSLNLSKPRPSDSGNYTCTARIYGQERTLMEEQLEVKVSIKSLVLDIRVGVQSVLLPCEFNTSVPTNLTVMWSRSDLTPSTVHQRQQEGDELKNQNQLYSGRTSMKPDALDTGDLSLNLTGLKLSDSGTYTCTVREDGEELRRTEVQLQVKGPDTGAAVILCVLLGLSLCAIMGLILKNRVTHVMEVDSGAESVKLPCRAKVHFPKDVRVEWTDDDQWKVYVYENGSMQHEQQAWFYGGRALMNRNPLVTGDLSLTLKYPTDGERGTYTCTVYSREGKVLMKKHVRLQVRVQKLVLDSGKESVHLPCETKVHLPEDVELEWRHSLYFNMLHVYRNSFDQPEEQDSRYVSLRTGHLSLTQKHPTSRESYSCTTSRGDGNILMDQNAELMVRVQKVEVESGVESVQLPCTSTVLLPDDVTVEWRDKNNLKIHVYKNRSDQPQNQDWSYRGGTEMKRNLLKTGDVSLTLKCPTVRDGGKYSCYVYNRDGTILMKKTIDLKVKVQQVMSGVESVQLPCRTTVYLPDDVTVEWINRSNLMVHVYENGSDQPQNQDWAYRGRTEMKRNPLETGDLSLTLKYPTIGGIYTCTVYSREGNILENQKVELLVRDCQVEVEEGVKSVQLPFKSTTYVPEDAKVWWRREVPEPRMKVHVHMNNCDILEEQNQIYRGRTELKRNLLKTGDVSLTLKSPIVRDGGKYGCYVYNRDGTILMKKTMVLKVKERK